MGGRGWVEKTTEVVRRGVAVWAVRAVRAAVEQASAPELATAAHAARGGEGSLRVRHLGRREAGVVLLGKGCR